MSVPSCSFQILSTGCSRIPKPEVTGPRTGRRKPCRPAAPVKSDAGADARCNDRRLRSGPGARRRRGQLPLCRSDQPHLTRGPAQQRQRIQVLPTSAQTPVQAAPGTVRADGEPPDPLSCDDDVADRDFGRDRLVRRPYGPVIDDEDAAAGKHGGEADDAAGGGPDLRARWCREVHTAMTSTPDDGGRLEASDHLDRRIHRPDRGSTAVAERPARLPEYRGGRASAPARPAAAAKQSRRYIAEAGPDSCGLVEICGQRAGTRSGCGQVDGA